MSGFSSSLTHVSSRGQRLRLRLLLEAADLKTLPWEYLYFSSDPDVAPDWSGFLALNENVSIVRHESIDAAEPPTPRGGTYRMVAALASPKDQDTLAPQWRWPSRTRGRSESSRPPGCNRLHGARSKTA